MALSGDHLTHMAFKPSFSLWVLFPLFFASFFLVSLNTPSVARASLAKIQVLGKQDPSEKQYKTNTSPVFPNNASSFYK